MTLQQKIVGKNFIQAIAEFDSNPLALVFLRRLANESPAMFFAEAVKHLSSARTSNAHRFLTVLALRNGELTDYLVNPAHTTREIALRLFNRMLSVDPSFDVKLAQLLPDRGYVNHAVALDGVCAARALDILDQTSRGRRLLPILGHLPHSSDPRVASKATLFVGRRVQSPAWSAKQMTHPDQRVRANAVESIWGLDTQPAVQLLENASTIRIPGSSATRYSVCILRAIAMWSGNSFSRQNTNRQLLAGCLASRNRTITGRNMTIAEACRIEQSHLLPLPEEVFGIHETLYPLIVDSKRRVRVKTNWYSAPLWPGLRVTARLWPTFIAVEHDGTCVASHPRHYGRGHQILNLEHYLDVLEKKPGAMAGSTPLAQWREAGKWPECLDRIWKGETGKGRSDSLRRMLFLPGHAEIFHPFALARRRYDLEISRTRVKFTRPGTRRYLRSSRPFAVSTPSSPSPRPVLGGSRQAESSF